MFIELIDNCARIVVLLKLSKTRMICICLIFVIIAKLESVFSVVWEPLDHVVTLDHGGRIQGRQLKSYNNNDYFAFQQIPYAVPPVGYLRFKEASEPKPWTGILKTTENTKVCIQLGKNDSRETEDCLYLNVYSPINRHQNISLLTVYFFIHGGFFKQNDGTFELFGPQFFMDYEIVLVTINYRLGAFGFLSTGDSVIPGNLGLKDQNLALKWVQKNIHLFGGDPHKVTIGGQSAGAASVGHHVLSKRSEGMFKAAIIQSGSPICSKMFAKHPRYFAFQLGRLLNKNLNDRNSSEELLSVLIKANANDIKKYSDLSIPDFLRNAVGNEANTVWNPIEEHNLNGFITGPMHENLQNGIFNKIPIFVGMTSEEEMHYDLELLKTKTSYFDSNSAYLINGNLNIKEENKLNAGLKMKKIYTKRNFGEDFGAFIRFISDAKYTNGICRFTELVSMYTNVYFYQFSYHGILNHNNKTVPGAEKVGHEEELNYLLQNELNRDINQYPLKDLAVLEQLLTIWTNFIKFEKPIPKDALKFSWPKVTPQNFEYVNINNTLEVRCNPRNYKEVKNVYEEYAEQFQYTY